MNEQSRTDPKLLSIIKSSEESLADIAAGRIEDLEPFMARMRAYVAKRRTEIDRMHGDNDSGQ